MVSLQPGTHLYYVSECAQKNALKPSLYAPEVENSHVQMLINFFHSLRAFNSVT